MRAVNGVTALAVLGLGLGGTAGGFVLTGDSWPTPETVFFVAIDYRLGVSPSGIPWDAAFAEAADHWNQVTAFDLQIDPRPSDPCAGMAGTGIPEDGNRNGVAFDSSDCGLPWGAGTLAVTYTYTSSPNSGITTETDILFNGNKVWDVYSGPWRSSVADFRRVAAHELGHVLGLGHEDRINSLMATFLSPGDTQETPTADDIAGVTALYGPPDEELVPILSRLEEPANGEIKTGISNLRGWAVSLAALDHAELYIDGVLFGPVPLGSRRPDIAAAHPGYPNAANSGFSLAFNYSELTPGLHSARVRVYDAVGRFEDMTHRFSVERFADPFIAPSSAVHLADADVQYNDSSIIVRRLYAGGEYYDVVLRWTVPSQDFQIKSINPAP